MVTIKDKITKSLSKATGIDSPNLEFSSRPEFGDYTSNAALGSKNPREEALKITELLQKDKSLIDIIEKIDVAGSGFINFHLSTKALMINLDRVMDQKENYGKSEAKKGQKVIVEYSSPNIAKPFTIGHLRSTIIGDAISNLLQAVGATVYRDNHLGDWGTQFGKQIYAIKTWGNEKEIEESENPVKELVALYIKFYNEAEKNPELEEEGRKWFKKLENGDEEARRLWQKCIEWSSKEFNKIYKELGVEFTENEGKGYGESYFEDMMQEVINELKKNKLLQKGNENAELVFFNEETKLPPLMIVKKDGASLYATRDLATDKWRHEKYHPDLIINEVGVEQSLYFKQLYELEKILGWYKEGQRIHIGHGHFRFKEGKMSTRKGNVIWLEDVLSEAKKRAEKFNKDTASVVGIGAIKYNDLKRDYKQDILFDWDEVLNMQGNSGPYLQYTYARTQSVLNKSNKKPVILSKVEGSFVEEELLILRTLSQFEEVIEESALKYSPSILCEYLYRLASDYNTFYNKVKIIGSEKEEFGLAFTMATGQVLNNGLTLLGIASPEKM